ncbi:MAG: metalloregulator ArsR/SmtB family transcription factor [Ilumatobacteraceae bacterium]
MPQELPVELLEHVAERFRVLGDATRLSILRTLLDDGEANVGELVERLGSSQANISKHLRVLQSAGIVARRPEGTAAYYSVADPSLLPICSIVCERLRDQVADDARTFSISSGSSGPRPA